MDEKSAHVALEVLQNRLLEVRENYKRDVEQLEHTIASIKRSAKNGNGNGHVEPVNGARSPLPGRWKGMGIREAIQAYLAQCDGPIPFQPLMDALVVGGVELGKKNNPERFVANVRTTLGNNRKRFRYNKDNDTVELRAPSA
jgi:hypothetical protein